MPVSWTNKAFEAWKKVTRKQGYRIVEVIPFAEMGESYSRVAYKLNTEVTFTVVRKEL